MNNLKIDKSDKILVIAPHPDDESIGTGGILSKYPEQCSVIVATDGAQLSGSMCLDEISSIRTKEFRQVMMHLNVHDYVMLQYPNGELIYHPECFDNLSFEKYTKVFIPNRNESHADHKAVYNHFIRKNRDNKNNRTTVFQYETRMPDQYATHYLDISDVIEKKIAAIGDYRSQCMAYCYPEFAKSLASFHACRLNKPGRYYEAYTLVCEQDEGGDVNINVKRMAESRKNDEFLRKWLGLETRGLRISRYIKMMLMPQYGLRLAIYGFGNMGRMLYEELETDGVETACILDNNADDLKEQYTIKHIRCPDEKYDDIDFVIVTNMFGAKEIIKNLHLRGYEKVMSLWDVMIGMDNLKN